MPKPKKNIQFKLEPEFEELLREKAKATKQKLNPCARELLKWALNDTERIELRTELEEVKRDLRKMRGDFATLGGYLLVRLAKESPEKAEAWVREHLAP